MTHTGECLCPWRNDEQIPPIISKDCMLSASVMVIISFAAYSESKARPGPGLSQ